MCDCAGCVLLHWPALCATALCVSVLCVLRCVLLRCVLLCCVEEFSGAGCAAGQGAGLRRT